MGMGKRVDEKALARVAVAMTSITAPEEMVSFLKELLTVNELKDITLRWLLMERLLDGETQRGIARELGISLCKITRGSRLLKQSDSVTARVLRHTRRS